METPRSPRLPKDPQSKIYGVATRDTPNPRSNAYGGVPKHIISVQQGRTPGTRHVYVWCVCMYVWCPTTTSVSSLLNLIRERGMLFQAFHDVGESDDGAIYRPRRRCIRKYFGHCVAQRMCVRGETGCGDK